MRRITNRSFYSSLPAAVLATVGGVVWLLLVNSAVGPSVSQVSDKVVKYGAVNQLQMLEQLPISFEPNRGQWDRKVMYRSRAILQGGYQVELHEDGPRLINEVKGKVESIALNFPGSAKAVPIEAFDRLPGDSNYFLGNEKSAWITGLPGYRKVTYRRIYPGIDLVLYGRGREVEFDFIVDAGADPELIRMAFIRTGVDVTRSGSDQINVTEDGSLLLSGAGVDFRLRPPQLYQESPSGRQSIQGRYHIGADDQVSFDIDDYDHSRLLVIDPIIVNSSFIGGSGQDTPYAITVDGSGNIYIGGQTRSSNFPVRSAFDSTINGLSDAFLVKINPTGTAVLMATFLGGRNPGDRILDVEVDREGLIYVCGETSSLSFPQVNPIQSSYAGNIDGFISVLSSNGSRLLFSSFLGGSSQDTVNGLIVDSWQNIYLTGGTRSANFPVVRALQPQIRGQMDAFVARIDRSGNLVFSTFLGGQDTGIEESEEETGLGIALDSLQNIYLTGVTCSNTFPLVTPIQHTFGGVADCFVLKLQSDGQKILYSTYLGGERADAGRSMAVDSFGQAVVTGYTFFRDFPVVNAFQPNYKGNLDAFVAKLAANGQRLIFSSFLGGSDEENASSISDSTPVGSIAIDRGGNIYVGGKTSSSDFPLVLPTQTELRGETDGFVCKLDPSGTRLLFSTYIGSSTAENNIGDERITGLVVDGRGTVLLTGSTPGGDFPIILPFQSGYGGGISDGFVASLTTPDIASLAAVSAASYNGGAAAPDSIVALFGSNLANGRSNADLLPLPQLLAGTSVQVEDRLGVTHAAGLFFASPEQINLHLPAGLSQGAARIRVANVLNPGGGRSSGFEATVRIEKVAPGIFTSNADGAGPPAAIIQRVRGGEVRYEPVAELSPLGRFEPRAIDLGPETDEVYLILFGTGWRGETSTSQFVVRVGGVVVPVIFAGAQGEFVGLDQLNIRLPRELIGRREVDLSMEVDGMIANIVRLYIY